MGQGSARRERAPVIKPSFLTDHMDVMSDSQLAQVTRLMHHIDTLRQALPLDIQACQRIARASTRDQQRDLDRLLADHFAITEQGRVPDTMSLRVTSQVRLGTTPGTTQASPQRHPSVARNASPSASPQDDGRATGDISKKLRQKRYRDAKAPMIKELRRRGVPIGKDTSMGELERLLGATPKDDAGTTGDALVRLPCAQILDTNTNTKYQRQGEGSAHEGSRATLGDGTTLANGATGATPAGTACLAMKAAGMQAVNPSHPELLALLAAGVGAQELADAAGECTAKGKPFAYALAMVRGRLRDAAEAGVLPAKQDGDAKLMEWAGPVVAAEMLRRKGSLQ